MNLNSENINELVAALSKAQGEIGPAIKGKVNPHFKNAYADLNSVWNACRDQLSKNGLAVTQSMTVENGQLLLVTTLAHSSGQWMRSFLPVISQRQDAQSLGSAITYMRRYSLSAMVGVAPDEDDDGEAAMRPNMVKKETQKVAQIHSPAISKKDAQDLTEILDECDPKYRQQVFSTLKNSNIESLEQVTTDIFPRLKAAAIRNRDAYQSTEEEEYEAAN